MSSRLVPLRLAIAVTLAVLSTASPLPGQERPHRLVLLGIDEFQPSKQSDDHVRVRAEEQRGVPPKRE